MKTRPGILVIGPTPPPHHGVSMATQAILESDLARQFRLSLVDSADRRGIEHVDKPDLYDAMLFVRQWCQVVTKLMTERPALVYLPISQWLVGFVRDSLFILPGLCCGARMVLHLHGSNFRHWYEGQSRPIQTFVRFILRRVAHVVVLGESFRGIFEGLIPVDRISVVPNGVHWEGPGKPVGDTAVGKRCRILYLGTVTRLKGVFVLLASIPQVVQVRDDVEFVFAGPWFRQEEESEASTFIHQHGLERCVTFTGPVTTENDKRRIYESADVFVFPGLQQEGHPLVVLEAMAAGLPVIYTNRGCLRETVIDGEQGWEVPINDAQALAQRLLWFCAHPGERVRMGRAARLHYEQAYTRERFVSNLSRVFTTVHEGSLPHPESVAPPSGKTSHPYTLARD